MWADAQNGESLEWAVGGTWRWQIGFTPRRGCTHSIRRRIPYRLTTGTWIFLPHVGQNAWPAATG